MGNILAMEEYIAATQKAKLSKKGRCIFSKHKHATSFFKWLS